MKIIVLGAYGYLGWPTCMHLSRRGHDVLALDNYNKVTWEHDVNVKPLLPVENLHKRTHDWNGLALGPAIQFTNTDLLDRAELYDVFDRFEPDAVVHYAEQPSAPWSMIDARHAVITHKNNVIGNLNVIHAVSHHNRDCHIIKLGTMGEYGTPNIQIEEGWLDVKHRGRKDRVLFPKKPGSWYHATKVHDSTNLEMACRFWGLRVSDLNQGVVYGVGTSDCHIKDSFRTSFHYDHCFGTVINRFVAQAVAGLPLTVYGNGSQTRLFIDIEDTVRCIEAAVNNGPERGEFRVMNQGFQQYSVEALALLVSDVTGAALNYMPNPRVEQEDHYYSVTHTKLRDLGIEPRMLNEDKIAEMVEYVERHKAEINPMTLDPTIRWNQI